MKAKKVTLFIVCLSIVLNSFFLKVSAENVQPKGEIPSRMAPNTVIEFTTDTDYIILTGGEFDPNSKMDTSLIVDNRSIEDIAATNAFEEWSDWAESQIDYQNVVHVEPVKPCIGMKVTYADDGYILNIQDNSYSASLEETKESRAARIAENGTYIWGSNNNTLTITSTYVKGKGRFTNFVDTIGQGDHTLKKGDVATKLAYDNCALGTVITCKANGYTRRMYKWDAGGMPDAILDIWKTGVEYFGYTWSASLSIHNGEYCYYR